MHPSAKFHHSWGVCKTLDFVCMIVCILYECVYCNSTAAKNISVMYAAASYLCDLLCFCGWQQWKEFDGCFPASTGTLYFMCVYWRALELKTKNHLHCFDTEQPELYETYWITLCYGLEVKCWLTFDIFNQLLSHFHGLSLLLLIVKSGKSWHETTSSSDVDLSQQESAKMWVANSSLNPKFITLFLILSTHSFCLNLVHQGNEQDVSLFTSCTSHGPVHPDMNENPLKTH